MKLFAKRVISVALAACMAIGSIAALNAGTVRDFAVKADAADTVSSGSCGDNVTYTLDSDGLLTISGTGEISNSPWNVEAVKSVVISDGVTSIGDSAFYYCTGLTSVTIPNSVTSIGEYAFRGCTALTSITIPNSVTSIGYGAFSVCTGLTSITIPGSVTSIDALAFSDCCNLMNITIADGVTGIGGGAFSGCANLKEICVDDGNKKYIFVDGVLFDKEKKSLISCSTGKTGEYTVPTGTKTIGDYAFYDCTGLTSVIISNGVTSIGNDAFSGCTGLTRITIPDSVTSIDWFAFYDCPATMTIIGKEGSYAQTYAKNQGFFVFTGDGKIKQNTEPTVDSVAEKIDTVKVVKTETGAGVLAAVGGTDAAAIRSAAQGAKIVDKDGKEVADTAPLATGMKIVVGGETVEIAVLGDIDGDAKISVADARLALRQAVSLENLQGVYLLAGKVGSDSVGVSEARRILRAAVKLEDSKDWIAGK